MKTETIKEYAPEIIIALVVSIVALAIIFMFTIGAPEETYEDEISSKYIKELYPEYENCTIEYISCLDTGFFDDCSEGANLYCDNNPNNRGGLKIIREKPTLKIVFNNITLEEINIMEIENKI